MEIPKFTNSTLIYLVNRESKQMFKARVVNVIRNLGGVDTALVPKYYRNVNDVFAWFLCEEIQKIEYDDTLAQKFDDETFIDLSKINNSELSKSDRIVRKHSLVKPLLIHLSDLHFGTDHNFKQNNKTFELQHSLVECLIEDIKSQKIDDKIGLLLITGDFTTRGDWSDTTMRKIISELKSLQKQLGLENDCILICPGNHDMIRYPEGSKISPSELNADSVQINYEHERNFRIFRQEFLGVEYKRPLSMCHHYNLGKFDIYISVIDSCRITATEWTEYGFTGEGGEQVLDILSNFKDKNSYKIMALHHHLLPVATFESPNSRGVSLTLDSTKLLEKCQKNNISMVFHGHQHIPKVSKYASHYYSEERWKGLDNDDIYIISSGSAGAGRLSSGETNSYSIISFQEDEANIKIRKLRPDKRQEPTWIEFNVKRKPE